MFLVIRVVRAIRMLKEISFSLSPVPRFAPLAAAFIFVACHSQAASDKNIKTWTDPELALKEDPDFALQGEYLSQNSASSVGVQVIALGNGQFEAYLLAGGLPGAGWVSGKARTLLKGVCAGSDVVFADTNKTISAKLMSGHILLTTTNGTDAIPLPRIVRTSPTLGAKPPQGAIILFDGTSADKWENGKAANGLLQATSCTTKQQFKSYSLHLEFRTPYMPAARGQARGNSGVYHSGRWETQILDSFGLEIRDNHCGGIYSISKPLLNMCLPPLAWQTYDVDFKAATFDAAGKRTAWPRITVKLNGVLVHENLELSKDYTTSAPITGPLVSPEGPVHLQNHKNPVVFRNIWLIEGK
jgi:hypothetical protein